MSAAAQRSSAEMQPQHAWPFWKKYLNLAQPRLGARVIACNDEFFGAAERLLQPQPAVFIPGKYDEHGKWMDGWETRRRREPGSDWCIVGLGAPSRLYGVDIDTSHFNGNQPEAARLWGARFTPDESVEHDAKAWRELVARTALGPSAQHRLEITDEEPVTHLKLEILPDGGVARLRAYGLVVRDDLPPSIAASSAQEPAQPGVEDGEGLVDLACVLEGASIIAASNEHFGAACNLLLPGRGLDMGDGWETARRRGPGSDWTLIELGCPGVVERVVVDTGHFKGNYPHQCSVQAVMHPALGGLERLEDYERVSREWPTLVPLHPLAADREHEFLQAALAPQLAGQPLSHVRLNMLPDGGISRLRVFGQPLGRRTATAHHGE